ncbi:MAG: adenosylcobalamin-dependent ribonucleoside-diphosphate reductase [Cyclobacteriaceae bacterium]|nr:adenosylcobalamin-dependent ribonucleoside-diphosphate reductase [Cyclobacteriaceae bacterium]
MLATKTSKKTFTRQEVLAESVNYFAGDELAATTWINKYCLRDAEGQLIEKSPADMHRRMAAEFYRAESYYIPDTRPRGLSSYGKRRKHLTEQVIFNLFDRFRYVVPQGSVMALLGNPYMIGSLSNCVVINAPVDSYGGIFHTDQQLAQLCKRRCGVGFDISTLRPRGMAVRNAAGSSSGVVSFMERFSNTTREVSQNGRRGALMLTMDITHPDAEDFIHAKQDLKKVTGANISVRLTDDFMKAVDEDRPFEQRWPLNSPNPSVVRQVDARELWGKIIQAAHKSAEPGIIFWDRQHWYSTSSVYPEFENASTNPCSEIAMQGGDSCRLMALNLSSFVKKPFTSEAEFDFNLFYEVTYEAMRLMDDLVTLELESVERIIEKIQSDPEPDTIKRTELATWHQLYENGQKGRRTGLGFTALADVLAAMGLKFDSDAAIMFIDEMMKKKCEAEFDSSIDLAIERGKFPAYDASIEEQSEFIQHMKQVLPDVYHRMIKYGRRNISISTVAPTGTVSLLAQTSSGIEPVFMLSYIRRRKVTENNDAKKVFKDEMGDSWEEFEVYHPKLKQWMEMYPEKKYGENPYIGSTAPEIDWAKRIEIQSVIQKYVTHSISSTINLPEDTAVSTVNAIYMQAWRSGLKGLTVYRDGSRAGVLVSNDKKETLPDQIIETTAPRRPVELEAKVVIFKNEDKNWMAFVGMLNGKPYEIFTGRAEDAFALPPYVNNGWIIKSRDKNNKSRYDFRYVDSQGYNVTIEGLSRSFTQEYWNYAKLISGILRHGMPLVDVVHLIDNLNLDKDYINTWKNGVQRALKHFIPNGTRSKDHFCPACHDEQGLVFEEGCLKCKSCGHTTCS